MSGTQSAIFKFLRVAALILGLVFCRGVEAQSVTLQWNASAGTAPAGYLVNYGTDGTNFGSQYDAGTNTAAILTEVQAGLLYYFEVVAYDTNGNFSTPSTEISYVIPVVTWTVGTAANPNNAGSVIGGGVYADGSEVTVTAAPNSGYVFANWTQNGTVVSASPAYTFSVGANQNLVANFIPKTITYGVSAAAGNNGSVAPSGSQTVNAGAVVGFTATPNSGYQVGQWLVNGVVTQTGGSAFTLQDVSTNCVVSVNFTTDPTVSVAVSPAGAGTISGGGAYPTGASVAVTAVANRGYTFTNWTENGIVQTASPSYSFVSAGNRNLVANFTVNPVIYTVTAAAVGNGSVTPPGPLPLTAGKGLTLFATPAAGYQISQWMIGGTLAQSGGATLTLQSISSNTTVTVNFQAEPTVTVAPNPGNAGTVSGGGSYSSGSQVTVTAAAVSGFAFTNWTENGVVQSTSRTYAFSVNGNRNLVANFAAVPIYCTVTASAGTNGNISPSGQQTVQAGASVTYSATAASGYQVNQWMVNGAVAQSGGAAFTLQNVAANSSVSVNFSGAAPVYYTVSAVSGSNGVVTPNGVHVVQSGAAVAFAATPNGGYAVSQWLLNGNLAQNGGASFSLNSINTNANVQVNFSAVVAPTALVDVTASPTNAGSVVGGGSFAIGATVTVSATPASGYAFTNWTENGVVASQFASFQFTLSSNRNLVANFALAPVYYTVTASAAANGSVTPSGAQSVLAGNPMTYTATPASGYRIGQWLVNGVQAQTGGSSFAIQNVSTNIAVDVTFSPIPPSTFTVLVDASPTNGGSVSGGGTFTANSTVTVLAVASNGFAFTNWTENGVLQCVTTNYTFTLSASRNLVANFVPVPVYYTVTASAGANGSVSPSGAQSVLQGSAVTLAAAPANGYQVGKWLVDGVPAQTNGLTLTLQDISSNTTVAVSFTAIAAQTFVVTTSADPTNGGFVTGGGTYIGEKAVTVTATATNGYTFAGWTEYGQVISTASNYTFTVNSSRNLVAQFTPPPVYYTVTANADANGSVSPSGGQSVLQGTAVTFVATPASGYKVGQWLVQGVPVYSGGTTFTIEDVTTNIDVEVTFSLIPPSTYAVAVTANPANGGSVGGGGTFATGSTVTVSAASNSGYAFTNWTENGVVQSTSANYSFTLSANRNLAANFVALPPVYTVTVTAGNNGMVSPSGATSVVQGGTLNLAAAAANGYKVDQWLVNGGVWETGGTALSLQNVSGNLEVLVTFTAISVSATNSTTNITLVIKGQGSVAPYKVGEVFKVGKKYSMTATPGKGYLFANWMSNGTMVATTPGYTFVAEANLALEAVFVPNPFIPVQGEYAGVFYDTNWATAESSGSIAMNVTSKGTYTARINVAGQVFSKTGSISPDGEATITITRPKSTPVTVNLQLNMTGGPLAGTVSDGSWVAAVTAAPAAYSAANTAPAWGRYTMVIPGSSDPSVAPGGDGYASVTVGDTGSVAITGLLGDGSPFSLTTAVNSQGEAPVYISLYGGEESVIGWLSFTNDSEIGGQLEWFRSPIPKAKLYPGGFATIASVVGSSYRVVKGVTPFNVTGDWLTLDGGNLVEEFRAPTGLDAQIQGAQPGTDKLAFSLNTGFFKASVINPQTGKPVVVTGAVLQNQNYGAGLFLGANETGGVYLDPGQ